MTVDLREVAPGDYEYLIGRVDEWWDGRSMAPMLPRLFFDHFPANTGSQAFHAALGFTANVVEDYDGRGENRVVFHLGMTVVRRRARVR